MNIDAAYIKQLNDKVGSLNMERQRQIGAVETAKKSFEAGLAQYNQMYGTQLTVDTLQAELDKVSANLANEAAEVERIIKTIEDGSYKTKTATAVTVTASDGSLLQEAPKMPSMPVDRSGSIGTGVTPQNVTTGVVAPSVAMSASVTENPAVNVAGNNSQSLSASAVQNSVVFSSTAQTAEFETFSPVSSAPTAATTAAQPVTAAPAFPTMGSPAPAETSTGQMMFGVEIPKAEMTTPAWASGAMPTTGEGINAQFSDMLGGKFSG